MICIKHYIHRQSLGSGNSQFELEAFARVTQTLESYLLMVLYSFTCFTSGKYPIPTTRGQNIISSHTTELSSIHLSKILTSSSCSIASFYVYLNTFEPHFLLAFVTKRSTTKPSEPPMYIHAKPKGQLFIKFHLNRLNWSLSLLLLPISVKHNLIFQEAFKF